MKLKILPNIHVRTCRTNSVENYLVLKEGFSNKMFRFSKVRTIKVFCQNLKFLCVFFSRCFYRVWKKKPPWRLILPSWKQNGIRIHEFYLYTIFIYKTVSFYLWLSCFFLTHMPTFKYLSNKFFLNNSFHFVLLWAQYTIAPTNKTLWVISKNILT